MEILGQIVQVDFHDNREKYIYSQLMKVEKEIERRKNVLINQRFSSAN